MSVSRVNLALILEWYEEQLPFRLDLVGDYAGSSRFLIHGDSLLRYCFSDPRIDFSPGFQLLHAVYVVEQFLQNLIRRNCVFDIVFLERDAAICVPSGRGSAAKKWLCARAVVVRHLLGLSGGHGEVKEFVRVNEDAFLTWITERRPLFIMTADGDDIGVNTKTGEEDEEEEEEGEDWDDEDEDDDEEDEEEEEEEGDSDLEEEEDTGSGEAKKWTIVAILYSLMHIGEGYNIALINRVEFVDSKVWNPSHCEDAAYPSRSSPIFARTHRVLAVGVSQESTPPLRLRRRRLAWALDSNCRQLTKKPPLESD